jgi:hypothetical protein
LPHQIVLDSCGILYVADRNAGRIQLFDQHGGDEGRRPARFARR